MSETRARAGAPEGIVFVDAAWDVRQSYRSDPLLDRFMDELKQCRLVGGVVPGTGRVIFPPRSFCELSFRRLHDLVPVGPGGTIRGFTRLMVKLGGGPPPPAVIVHVQLDGADTASPGYLRGAVVAQDPPPALIGVRCRAVFKDHPDGDWSDFWFELED
jgi:uncharacterized OB-fold protein